MYDAPVAWETWDTSSEPDVIKEFASLWRGTDKIVFSRTLDKATSSWSSSVSATSLAVPPMSTTE